jgi:hypothetical protein
MINLCALNVADLLVVYEHSSVPRSDNWLNVMLQVSLADTHRYVV